MLEKICYGLIGFVLLLVKITMFIWFLPFAFFMSMLGLGLMDIFKGKY